MTKWNDASVVIPVENVEVLAKLSNGEIVIAKIVPVWYSLNQFDPNAIVTEWLYTDELSKHFH